MPFETVLNNPLKLGPLVLGISPPELRPHRRITPGPEPGEILGDLHGAGVGREDFDDERNLAFANRGRIIQPPKVLNENGYSGLFTLLIKHSRFLAVGKGDPLRGEMIECFCLMWWKPLFQHRPDGAVFDLLVTQGAVSDLLEHEEARIIIDRGEFVVRAVFGREVDPGDPGGDLIVPRLEVEFAGEDAAR